MATRAELVQAYLAYFGRPPDFDGLKFYENIPFADVISNFSKSPESQALYGTVFGAAQVNAIYQNLFNRDAEPAGLDYWSGRVNSGALSPAAAAYGIMLGAQNADKTSVDNKIAIINLFESKLDTAAEIVGYSGAAAAASARAYIKTVSSDAATVTSATTGADAAVAAAVSAGSGSTGTSFSLTTGVDSLVGTAGADTFIADNSGTAVFLSAADTINGGDGIDTLKVFLPAAGTTVAAAAVTNVENLLVNGGVVTALDLSTTTYTGLTVESPVLTAGALAAATYTVKQGQAVTLKGATVTANSTTNVTQSATSTASSLNLTLDGWTAGTGVTNTVNVVGGLVKTLNIAGANNASKIVLTNTGTAGLNKLVLTGSVGLNVTESLAGIETIDASGHTGATTGVTIDMSGVATPAAAFSFKGGSGNDSIKLSNDAIGLLTAGTQLDGGAGASDKLGTLDVAFSAGELTRINAATGFEILGLNAAITVDASKLTTIKSFALDTDAVQTISNFATGSTVSFNAAHASATTLTPATGVNDLTINVGTGTTGGLAIAGTVTVGATAVALKSNGTNAAANVITTLANADNSTYTVTGSNDLTITNALAGTATGSKVDGTAFTGKLSVTGSAQSDILIGGTGDDTLGGGTITAGVAAVTAVNEVATMTGAGGMTAGQTYTIAGLTYTSTGVTTQAELLTAFASLANGATTGGGTATGTYTGTLTGYSTGAVAANVVTFTSTGGGNVADLTDAGTGAAAANVAVTTQGVAGVTAVTASADTITGGAGADTFVFAAGALDTTVAAVTATITDFVTGVDKIKIAAGSTTTYLEATTAAADLATLLTAADTALNGAVLVYVGQVGSDSYAVTDVNGNGYTNVIKLTGVALTAVAAGDFIA